MITNLLHVLEMVEGASSDLTDVCRSLGAVAHDHFNDEVGDLAMDAITDVYHASTLAWYAAGKIKRLLDVLDEQLNN